MFDLERLIRNQGCFCVEIQESHEAVVEMLARRKGDRSQGDPVDLKSSQRSSLGHLLDIPIESSQQIIYHLSF